MNRSQRPRPDAADALVAATIDATLVGIVLMTDARMGATQIKARRGLRLLLCGAVAAGFMASAAPTLGDPGPQADPRPAVKWHPGHYLNGDWGRNVDGTIAQARKSSAIKGVSFLHGWWELETAPGTFNFAKIDAQLAKAQAAGLQMMIQIADRTFSLARPNCVPAYMLTDPQYQGGQSIITNAQGKFVKGTALRFVPAVQDRMIALYQALGARYDGDPTFEAIAIAEEDDFGTNGSHMAGFSTRAYNDQEKRGMTAAAAAFPHTITFKWLNWGPGNAELFAHAARLGMGVGAPDLDPKSHTFSYPERYQEYFGRIPLSMAVQWPRVEKTIRDGSTVSAIARYGTAAPPAGLGLNYIIWDAAHAATIDYDRDIVPALNATPATQAVRPSTFTAPRGGDASD